MPTLNPRFALVLALVLSLSSTHAIPFNPPISPPVSPRGVSIPNPSPSQGASPSAPASISFAPLRPEADLSASGPVATTATALRGRQTGAPSSPSLSAPAAAQVTDAVAVAQVGPVNQQTGETNGGGHVHDNNPSPPPSVPVLPINPRSVQVRNQSSRKRDQDRTVDMATPLGNEQLYHDHHQRDHHHHHHNHHPREDPQGFNGRPPMQGWVQPRGDDQVDEVGVPGTPWGLTFHQHDDRAAQDAASGKDISGGVSSTKGTGVTDHENTGEEETRPDAVAQGNAANKASAGSHVQGQQ